MWLTILVQFVAPAVAALFGGIATHLWHTRGSSPASSSSSPTPSNSAMPTPGVPLPVPSDLFPKHPLLSHLIGTYSSQLEAALLGQLKSKLGLDQLASTPK